MVIPTKFLLSRNYMCGDGMVSWLVEKNKKAGMHHALRLFAVN